jgi:hypothetical protein
MNTFLGCNPELFQNLICPKCGCSDTYVIETANFTDSMGFAVAGMCQHMWNVVYSFKYGDIYSKVVPQ